MKMDIDKQLLKALLILGSVIEARDSYTGGHLWRVAQFSRLLGEKMGLSRSDIFVISIGGFLHDLGKVGVPDGVLLNKGKLEPHEYEIMKTHPTIGGNLLREHPLGGLVLDSVVHHHERYDGSGYPDGLTNDETSIFARMTAISDAFDAMTSTRSYHKAIPVEEALLFLQKGRNRFFDGILTDYFIEMGRSNALNQIVGHSDHERPLVDCPFCGPVIAIPKSRGDGDLIHCKVCRGEFRLHKDGNSFTGEFTGNHGTAEQVKPEAEMDPIHELMQQAPQAVPLPI